MRSPPLSSGVSQRMLLVTAVDTHPRPDIDIRLADGRRLVACDLGAENGQPVVALHGTPGSRLMLRPADAIATRLGLRLIVPDRPGCGLSSPHPGRTLTDFAGDLAQLLDILHVPECALIGISGGGPYAIAAAARLSDRLSRVALISPVGPLAEHVDPRRLSLPHRRLFLHLGQQRTRARLLAAAGIGLLRLAPLATYSQFARLLGPADAAILTPPHMRDHVLADALEGVRQGSDGALGDLALFGQPWGFDPQRARQPVVIWHAPADRLVPFEGAAALARLLPNVELRPIANAGHFWIYANLETVLREVAVR